jgi:hypothetical protein
MKGLEIEKIGETDLSEPEITEVCTMIARLILYQIEKSQHPEETTITKREGQHP